MEAWRAYASGNDRETASGMRHDLIERDARSSAQSGHCEIARMSDGRVRGLIRHEVFGTFVAGPNGLLTGFSFLSR